MRNLLIFSVALLSGVVNADYLPTVNDPNAPDPQRKCPGYRASNVQKSEHGVTATLNLAGIKCNMFGSDIDTLSLNVEYQDAHRLYVNIQPTYLDSSNITHFILDENLVVKPSGELSGETDLDFSWGNDPSFWFQISRKSTGDKIFDTKGNKLVFENQFFELKNNLPKGYNIAGLGERIHGLAMLPGEVATSWNTDNADTVDSNLYGSHPFYMETRYVNGKDANSHGVYLRNAHGAEAVFHDDSLVWRYIGGSIDLYFFDGPSAAQVTQQYTDVIGKPAMQQYWTLGFHQCAWGYSGWLEIQESIQNYAQKNIPLETQWIDIDYMWGYRDFTVDQVRFRDDWTQSTMDMLHNNHQHFVPIVDAGIKYTPGDDSYGTYGRGHNLDVYIKNPDGSPFVGKVWPGEAVWVDWHNPSSWKFWSDELENFHKELPFDGIWIDMSEPSNFCDGSCGTAPTPAQPLAPGERDINHPPYKLKTHRGELYAATLSTNATYASGMVEYDVHNLYGYHLLNATNYGLANTMQGKRPFIIGRSTFAGSGVSAGHWGGDNQATWESMASSIPQGLTFSLFGIPMFGVDTCGFSGETTEELCGRWMQLSAFFPFYRNHYATGAPKHEAWRWDSVTQYSIDIMKIRYSLLPYFYTLMNAAHQTGSTVLRAISWEFPRDSSLFGVDKQFLVGPGLMVIPVLTQGATTVNGFLPGEDPWYDWYSQSVMPKTSQSMTINAPLGHLPLFIRGGTILPQQEPSTTIYKSRQGKWSLIVALNNDGAAAGSIYLDDGTSINPSQVQTVTLEAKDNKLTARISGSYNFADLGVSPPPLDSITILGVQHYNGGKAKFNNNEVGTDYDSTAKKLVIHNGLSSQTSRGAWWSSWTLSW